MTLLVTQRYRDRKRAEAALRRPLKTTEQGGGVRFRFARTAKVSAVTAQLTSFRELATIRLSANHG